MTEKKSSRERWSKKRYLESAKALRKYGYKTSLSSKSFTDGKKKAVKKRWKTLAAYALHVVGSSKENRKVRSNPSTKALTFVTAKDGSQRLNIKGGTEQNFIFKKLTPSQRKKFKGLFSENQFTPNGIFIEKPASLTAKQFKVEITKDGVLYKAGKRKDLIIKIDPRQLARDPKKAIAKAMGKRKPKGFAIMVNGFRGKNSHPIKNFFHYAENTLLEIYEREEMTAEEFSDIFHLRLLY